MYGSGCLGIAALIGLGLVPVVFAIALRVTEHRRKARRAVERRSPTWPALARLSFLISGCRRRSPAAPTRRVGESRMRCASGIARQYYLEDAWAIGGAAAKCWTCVRSKPDV